MKKDKIRISYFSRACENRTILGVGEMSVVSFVIGAEVHKTSIVEMVKEMLPEHEFHTYKAAFIDDLFEANKDSELVILDLEARISLREVMRFYKNTDTKVAVILPDSEAEEIETYSPFNLVGFFIVDMDIHEFADGINYMLKDTIYFHPRIAEIMYKNYKQLLYKEIQRPEGFLTRREWEILAELVNGFQNDEIAENLAISDKTVKNHITSILRKLDVKDRTNAVLMALRERWFYL